MKDAELTKRIEELKENARGAVTTGPEITHLK